MKPLRTSLLGIALIFPSFAQAQDVFVYPAKGQGAEQQVLDKAQCAEWAKQETGFDPMNPPRVEVAQVQDRSGGAAARGMARGALVGSLVGKATDSNRSEAGAVGALVGGVRSGKTAQAQQQAQTAQAEKQAEGEMAQMRDRYNRAYRACLQGRGYTTE